MEEVREGDFTLVAGFPGNTNRYRESLSASYNLRKGIPDQIRSLEDELRILRRHAAADSKIQVILQSRIFGLANSLKYEQDLLAALKVSDVVAERQRRERDFMRFLDGRPDLKKLYGDVIDAQAAVYANDVEAHADLDAALNWIQKSSVVSYASALHEFAAARAQASDRDRDPQFQERNWPRVRESLLDDEPLVPALEEDLLTEGFTRALKLTGDQAIPAVQRLAERVARDGAAPNPRDLARAVLAGSSLVVGGRTEAARGRASGHLRVLNRSGDRVRPRPGAIARGSSRARPDPQREDSRESFAFRPGLAGLAG